MAIRITKRTSLLDSHRSKHKGPLSELQSTIKINQGAFSAPSCPCQICAVISPTLKKSTEFAKSSQNSSKWLKILLNGLCISGVKSLKLYIPDIFFIEGSSLMIFHTDSKENRVKKVSGTTPAESLYPMMIRLRQQYKGMLEETFNKSIIDELDPQFIHEKYLNKLLPTSFHDGDNVRTLSENINKVKRYILHKNQKYIINSIQEHKIYNNEPFCTLRFTDGNSQLFSKNQFETLVQNKLPNDVCFIQSYIKEKQQSDAVFTFSYSQASSRTDKDLFSKAEIYVLLLIEGIGKFDHDYQDIQLIEDGIHQLMKDNISLYCKFLTYQIVHYLAMVSRVFVKHIKINWVLNDLGFVYFQSLTEFQTSELADRTLRYQMPPKGNIMMLYKHASYFMNLYKHVQTVREQKKREFQILFTRKNQQKSEKSQRKSQRSEPIKTHKYSKTIDYSTISSKGRFPGHSTIDSARSRRETGERRKPITSYQKFRQRQLSQNTSRI